MTVTDEQIKERLAGLLAESDLQVTTEKMLRKALEKEFGEDLAEKKDLIRQEVTAFLEANQKKDGDEEEEAEEEEEEEDGEEGGGGKRGRGGGGGFSQKSCVLSEEMQAFVGAKRMPRTQVVREIWAYIKANNLQDPKNKRNIIVDEKLATIFTPPVNMFSMNKQLSKHVKAADSVAGGSDGDGSDGGGGAPAPRRRAPAKPRASGSRKRGAAGGEEGGEKKKRAAGGFCAAMRVSAELAAVTGRDVMTRSDITSWFWAYVKAKGIQDPADKSYILADATLKALFKEDRFKGFGFQKLIKPHLLGKAEGGSGGGGGGGDEDGGAEEGGDEEGGDDEGVKEEQGGGEEEGGVKEEEAAAVKEAAVKEEAAAGAKAEDEAMADADGAGGAKQEEAA